MCIRIIFQIECSAAIAMTKFPTGARKIQHAGRPLDGPLALPRGWNHEVTVWPMASRAAVWQDDSTYEN